MTTDRLILFTRYPEPGKAKTRLISALGAAGAAALHQQMVEHTLAQVRSLRSQRDIAVEVRFAGGNVALMQEWLGQAWDYQPQGTGDLGDRLAAAAQAAFAAGSTAVVMIGSDCPGLDASLLDRAFAALQQHDLVLGPATDGGYYLIGLRRFAPDLFQGIAWSTAAVLRQTVAIATQLNLRTAYLPALSDVDCPADLVIWQQANAATTVSVIIPVLNEENYLPTTITIAQAAAEAGDLVELIVVDGGSTDSTVEIAKSQGLRVLQASGGRAVQMNVGAAAATGDLLLFLHGDTRLPTGFDRQVRATLGQPGVVAGAFELKIGATLPGLRLVEWGVQQRSRWLQMPYGDQAIFLKAATFQQLGGFPELPIMEDFELMRQLKRLGRVAIVPTPVVTSGRRWQRLGVLQTTLLNQGMILAYLLGVSPAQLVRWYRETGKKSAQRNECT